MRDRRPRTRRERQLRYDRFKRRSEIPMLVLSVLLVPVVLMPFLENLSHGAFLTLEWIGIAIWAVFAIQYCVLVYLSPHRRRTIMTHKLDLLLVVLPFLRPLRLARLVRLAQAGAGLARAAAVLHRLLHRPGFGAVIAVVGGFIVTGGGFVAIAEHQQPDARIDGFADGLWWAFVTCTTVGYGDEFPVTTTGRLIAVVLMIAGISGLSVITANIAAYFVSVDAEDDVESLSARLARIEQQLEHLTARTGATDRRRRLPADRSL